MAAIAVREFEAGRGMEVGGGDRHETIVRPRPIAEPSTTTSVSPSRHRMIPTMGARTRPRDPAFIASFAAVPGSTGM